MKTLYIILSWLIVFCIPFILMMTSIRLLVTPFFPQMEYRTPFFPDDPYGFSFQDRLKWSTISIEYLTNPADLSFLSDLRLSDGTPLYNDRELSHMLDVKVLIQRATSVWIYCIIGIVALGLWAKRGGWILYYWVGISRGGWLTIGLIILVFLAIMLNFDTLFTDFHRIFFQGSSWLFYYSDSLIRLFPIRFWQDAFIFMGIISLIGGLLAGIFGRRLAQNARR